MKPTTARSRPLMTIAQTIRYRRNVKLLRLAKLGLFIYGFVILSWAVGEARTAARKSSAKCALKGLGLGFHNYADAEGGLPPHTITDEAGKPLYGWAVPLLPYLDDKSLYDKIDLTKAWNDPTQIELFKTPARMLTGCANDNEFCDDGFPLSNYAANSQLMRVNEVFALDEITDGTEYTLLIGEITEGRETWGKPGNVRDPALGFKRGPTTFGGPYKGVTQFCLADGSVRAISDDIDPAILRALATPNAGDDLKGFEP